MSGMKNIVGIIPARYASTRFPGKPLHVIGGKPLIQHVVERCRESARLTDVIVATDDRRIAEVTGKFCRTEMTRGDHPSGTDRIAEVAGRLGDEVGGIVNIQGDEPLIDPGVIDAVAVKLEEFEMSTAAVRISDGAALSNPNIVKVVMGAGGRALYFSRSMIPYVRDHGGAQADKLVEQVSFFHHLGIYGYRRTVLENLVQLPVSVLEEVEKLEQLRALEAGISIGVVVTARRSIGVDTPEDAELVEKLLAQNG